MESQQQTPNKLGVIEWAFVCGFAESDERGGVNASHIFDKFTSVDLPGPFVVIRLTIPRDQILGGRQTYHFLTEFILSLHLKTAADEEIKIYSSEQLVREVILMQPLGAALHQPGRYTLDIRVDGALQQALTLFVS